jgi:hypothetical protein
MLTRTRPARSATEIVADRPTTRWSLVRRRAGLICALALVTALGSAASASAGVPYTKGDVFAGEGNGLIKEFKPDGTLVQTLDTTSGSTEDTGMCFDGAGNLYSTNFEANSMSKFDNSGNLVAASFGSGFNAHPESCVFNKAGNMYVGQADGSRQVLEFNSSGALLNSFSPAPDARGTDWIDLAADQTTLRYTSEGSLVKQFNLGTSTQLADFASGLPAPCYAHRILSGGGDLVACASEVVRLDSSGAIVQTYPVDPSQNLFALNIDPDGTSFWTADFNGTIYHVDIATGLVINSFNASPAFDVAGLAVFGETTQGGPPPSGCTMTGKGQFTSGGQEVRKEDTLNSDTTQPQHLVFRSLNGTARYFRLDKLSTAACHDNVSFPKEEGGSFNTFTGDGSGSFGTDLNHTTSGYTIHFELGDRGDSATSDNTKADSVNYTIKNSSGAVVWTSAGNAHLSSGSQEMTG